MKICVIGGGNIGTLLAAEFANQNYNVWIYTGRPEKWSDTLEVYSAEDKMLFRTRHFCVTGVLEEA